MLAHGSIRGNETRGRNGKFYVGGRDFFALELWKVVRNEDKIARTSTRDSLTFADLAAC